MRKTGLVAFATAALVLAGAAAAHAQSWKADIGVNGGGSWYSSLLSSDNFGSNGDAIRFKGNWLTGAQLGFWFTPRIGLRANGTYTDTKLKQGNGFFASDNVLYGDVNLWSASGDLMFRFKEPAPAFTKMEALPYIALGLGAKKINPAGDFFSISSGETGVPFTCGGSIPSNINLNGGTCSGPATGTGSNFFLAESWRLMGLVGLGTDLRLARNFALRLEVNDRLYKPKVFAVAPSATFLADPGLVTASSTTSDNLGKLVNEVGLQIGSVSTWG